MTTWTATVAGSTKPVNGMGLAGTKKTKTGSVTFTSAGPAAADTIEFVRVPKGAIVTGGRFYGGTLEVSTSGAALDIDIGWADNGTDTSDTDGFGNFGVLSTAAVTGYKPETAVFHYPLGGVLFTAGPKTFAAETVIKGTVVASSSNLASGTLFLEVDYVVP